MKNCSGIAAGITAGWRKLRRRAVEHAQLRARELARAEALEWALEQIAARSARPEVPASRGPGESLAGYWEHMEIDTRRLPR